MSRTRDILKTSFVALLVLTTTLVVTFTSAPNSSYASTETENTLMQPEGTQDMGTTTTNAATSTANATATKPNIVLVHGGWADGGSWGKVIPTLTNAGYRVIAVQLPLHNTADDIATVKRAVELVGGPTILVGHSYGGYVISNAAWNISGFRYVSPALSTIKIPGGSLSGVTNVPSASPSSGAKAAI